MIEKDPSRRKLKLSCLGALDALAVEHESGHQGKLAARYTLRTEHGMAVELMFEKSPKTPANLWMTLQTGRDLLDEDISYRLSPASEVNHAFGADGRPKYGRHSALKTMHQLAHADLICFRIEREGQIEALLARLSSGSSVRGSPRPPRPGVPDGAVRK